MKQIPVITPPTLSIVMPFFNHEELVAEMIDSIRANDYQDWELLAIDDGSTAETAAFLSKRYQDDGRIRFIPRNREPKGAQTCRNMGLEKARGEYIVFFDSDDYVAPYCLRQRVEAMEQGPHLDFMVFPSGSYDGQCFSETGPYVFGMHVYNDDMKAFILRTLPFTVWTNIYRTETLRTKHLLWDTNILSLQDSDFNIQALLHGLSYAYANVKPDYGYRTVGNNDSISKNISSKAHRESHLYFLDKQYTEIQRVYKSQYDKSLYRFALLIYTRMQYTGFNLPLARQIAGIVYNHDKFRGRILFFKVNLSRLLATFLPSKVARQLPMPVFLLRSWWNEKMSNRTANRSTQVQQ